MAPSGWLARTSTTKSFRSCHSPSSSRSRSRARTTARARDDATEGNAPPPFPGSGARHFNRTTPKRLRALERVVDLLQEVSGLVRIGGPGRIEVLERIERHDFVLALALAEQLLDALACLLHHRVVLG